MDSVFDKVHHIDVSDADVVVFKSNIERDMKHAFVPKTAVIVHRDTGSTSEDDTWSDDAWTDNSSIPFFQSIVLAQRKCGWKPSVNARSDAEKIEEFTAHLEEVTEQCEREF